MTAYRDRLNAGAYAPTDQEEKPVTTRTPRHTRRTRSSGRVFGETPAPPTPDPEPEPEPDDGDGDGDDA